MTVLITAYSKAPICEAIRTRRQQVDTILRHRIAHANQVTKMEGVYSPEAAYAWDVVHELSHAIRGFDLVLEYCMLREHLFAEDQRARQELSQREYDV